MNAGDLVAGCLAGLGVTRVFTHPDGGRTLPALPSVPVADDRLAAVLADADGRLNRMGAALLSDGVLRLSSRPGAEVEPVAVDDPADIPEAMVFVGGQELPGAHAVRLDVPLDGPVPDGLQPVGQELTLERIRLSPDLGTDGILVLAGPGVVREDAVDDLAAFASATGWGVVTTFGALGAVPEPVGTAGLQERDFALAGLTEALFVVVVGVDPDEVPPGGVGDAQQLTLHPRHLPSAAAEWPSPPPSATPDRPLADAVAAVVGPGRAVEGHPAAAVAALAGEAVAADPGPAGLWVARAHPAPAPGQALVPATVAPGFAAAAALVDALDGRTRVAVTTHPVDDTTGALVALAAQLEVPIRLEAWGSDAHPVDFAATRDLVELAGPVTAWS